MNTLHQRERDHFKDNPFAYLEVCLWQEKHFRKHLARCAEVINTNCTMTKPAVNGSEIKNLSQNMIPDKQMEADSQD